MFLLVLVTCVTLQGQTMCHVFEREQAYSDENACLLAAAMERGRYNSRMQRREWARYKWECRNKIEKEQVKLSFFGSPVSKMHP